MIKIAIVEDDKDIAYAIERMTAQYMGEIREKASISIFNTAEAFLFSNVASYDLVLLDILLPCKDGMKTAEELCRIAPNTLVVLVTAVAQYAVDGYSVGVFDFIVKPVSYYTLALKLQRAVIKLLKSETSDKIIVQDKNETNVINTEDIYYVEVTKHKVTYYTKGGEFSTTGTMKNIVEKLQHLSFALCNQSYLVNLKYVTKIDGYTVTVAGKELAISRSRRNEFKRALNEYISATN